MPRILLGQFSEYSLGKTMSSAPLRFELLINGEKVTVAGVNDFGVMSGIVSWVKRSPSKVTAKLRARDGFDEAEFLKEVCEVTVTGLDSSNEHHFQWVQRALVPGDEVTFRILSQGDVDVPQSHG